MRDIGYTLRILARSPLLTLVVVLSLGLGIGANTAIFSMLHQVVLRSLPVERPEEIVILNSPEEFKSGRISVDSSGGGNFIFSYRMFRLLEKEPQGVSGIAGFRLLDANISYRNQTVDGVAMVVSGQYFPLLGVKARMGRLIEPEDDVHGAGHPVAVLSHGYWQNNLGGREDVLNKPLRVNGQILTIVGVAAPGFTGMTFGESPDVFVPLALKPFMTPGWDGTDSWDDYWLYLFARLKPGVSRQQAEQALNASYRGFMGLQATESNALRPERRERFLKSQLTLLDGSRGAIPARDSSKTPILILMAATALVLLIAIANTANLLLARAAQRRKELAIRTALGASRLRIMQQALTEALVLSLAGGLAGLLFAVWTISFMVGAITGGRPTEELSSSLEWPVLLFALGISLVSGVLAGLYPAWEAARSSVAGVLKDHAANVSSGLGAARVRKLLVCAQVMASALLLIPTGLFMKSLVNLLHVDLGIRVESMMTFRISPELNGYKPAQSRALIDRAEQQLSAIPGVRGVATSLVPLLDGSNWVSTVKVEGFSRDANADRFSMYNVVGAGFFSKMGIPLISGREFTERDTMAGPKVAVVNEQFARHFFGDQNPIGRKFAIGPKDALDTEIIGVVKDMHYADVKEKRPRLFFTPWAQSEGIGSISFYVWSELPAGRVASEIRRVMNGLDPDLPLQDLRTMEEQVRRNIRSDHLILQLSATFAIVATLLAMIGLYGVMAYNVTRRTREIGIRIALGAEPESIRRMVLSELLVILGVGMAAGIPAAIALARFTESQLFGVKSFDAAVIAGAAVALTIASLLAGAIPARRATRVDPVVALRYE